MELSSGSHLARQALFPTGSKLHAQRGPDWQVRMTRLRVTLLTPTIGGLIEDVDDLSVPLDDDTIAEIRSALLNRRVLFFTDQHITPAQHRDFASRFGNLHPHP